MSCGTPKFDCGQLALLFLVADDDTTAKNYNQRIRVELEGLGLICPRNFGVSRWMLTPRGEALVEHIRNLPLPVAAWNMPKEVLT